MKPANARLRVLPFTPAVPEPIAADVRAQPYAPRLARALTFLLGAVSLHVWAVSSPQPQPMPLAAFAARVMLPPAIPAAPSVLSSYRSPATSKRRVVVQQMLVRVTTPYERASQGLLARQPDVPVGTTGLMAVAATPAPMTLASPAPAAALDRAIAAAETVKPAGIDTVARVDGRTAHATVSAPPSIRRSDSVVSIREPDSVVPPAEPKRLASAAAAEDKGSQTEVVLAVLREYSRAYERMDVNATKALYPSVDARGLRKAFDGLEQQRLQFGSCGVSFSASGADANAWCKVDATYRPKIGSKVRVQDREWTFSLAREGDGWQIMKMTVH